MEEKGTRAAQLKGSTMISDRLTVSPSQPFKKREELLLMSSYKSLFIINISPRKTRTRTFGDWIRYATFTPGACLVCFGLIGSRSQATGWPLDKRTLNEKSDNHALYGLPFSLFCQNYLITASITVARVKRFFTQSEITYYPRHNT